MREQKREDQMNLIRIILAITLYVMMSPVANAVFINFEDLATGTPVTTEYQSFGVIFSSPPPPGSGVLTLTTFSTNSTTGNVLTDTTRRNSDGSLGNDPYQIIADFLHPVSMISVTAYANPLFGLTMDAYNSSDVLLSSITSTSNGIDFNQGTIGFSGIGDISRVVWKTTAPITALPGIDNLEFNAVPVPTAVWLFGSGLIGLVGVARRKKA